MNSKIILSLALLFLLIFEPVRVMIGPVRLMNEYPEIYSQTFLGGSFVDNGTFLIKLMADDSESLKEFRRANWLEVHHQNMGRGQINHIGHVLNPLNEYILGKPLREIYFQYGLGDSFLMKWVMECFGGLSFNNYYKVYLFYIVYSILVFSLLYFLFQDRLYLLGSMAILPVCFFYMGYIAFILAPGIIPSIHLLDAPVWVLLLFYFRGKRKHIAYLGGIFILTLLSILINRQFGITLSASVFVSLMVYGLENRRGRSKLFWLIGGILGISACIFLYWISNLGTFDTIFWYLWHGLFSWPAKRPIIAFAIFYLVISYSFLLWLKDDTSYLKYVYVFNFFYAQGTLLYYFWSGLINHLPPVFPFVWFQFFTMLYITRDKLSAQMAVFQKIIHNVARIATLLMFILIIPTGLMFYKEKNLFQNNFREHQVYQWDIERAKIVSTVNPQLIQESLALIRKYSSSHSAAIFIISKYDAFLPFLAYRYSAMPFFEMNYCLFSEKESRMTVEIIEREKAEYIFVDRDIKDRPLDLWGKIYQTDFFRREENARFGRYAVLREVFVRVENQYHKLEEGGLLSVYKRKGLPQQPAREGRG